MYNFSSTLCGVQASRLPWFNSTVTDGKFKEGHDAQMAKKRYNQPIFTKNHNIFTTLVSFGYIAAMSRVGFKTQ